MSGYKKLILVTLIFISSHSAYAGQISVPSFSADSNVAHLNTFRTTVVNVINGSIEGSTDGGSTVSNIAADSLYEINMANDANPRVRDSELLGITTDNTTTQSTFVYSGCTPAVDTDLTSDISTCVAYVNGYRVTKGATAQTYTATRDNYVDISQAGVYTVSAVTVGASAPSVASNSARVAKVTTDGTQILSVTDLANRRLPGLVTPANYRTGLVMSKDSSTTVTVQPGSCEINNTMLSKTSATTLTLTTAGDWAGGVSLRAANTMGFVGVDVSGNLKMHTTAPTNSNYAVSLTAGKKRYATWSSTVYRILGWFYMDGAQIVETASNIKEGDVSNTVISNDITQLTLSGGSFVNSSMLNFYNSGGNVLLYASISGDTSVGSGSEYITLNDAGSDIAGTQSSCFSAGGGPGCSATTYFLQQNVAQGNKLYRARARDDAGSDMTVGRKCLIISEQ